MYEELRIVPSQLSQEKRSTGLVEPEVLVLSPNPRLQLLIDVIDQREQRGTAEPTVIINPPPEERIDLFGDFSQRPRRLPGNVQAPDRCSHGLQRCRTDRRGVSAEELRPL